MMNNQDPFPVHYRCNKGVWEKRVPLSLHLEWRDWMPCQMIKGTGIKNWLDRMSQLPRVVLHKDDDIE
jgi:hypothetical protein